MNCSPFVLSAEQSFLLLAFGALQWTLRNRERQVDTKAFGLTDNRQREPWYAINLNFKHIDSCINIKFVELFCFNLTPMFIA